MRKALITDYIKDQSTPITPMDCNEGLVSPYCFGSQSRVLSMKIVDAKLHFRVSQSVKVIKSMTLAHLKKIC